MKKVVGCGLGVMDADGTIRLTTPLQAMDKKILPPNPIEVEYAMRITPPPFDLAAAARIMRAYYTNHIREQLNNHTILLD
jgi:hypothetical protein